MRVNLSISNKINHKQPSALTIARYLDRFNLEFLAVLLIDNMLLKIVNPDGAFIIATNNSSKTWPSRHVYVYLICRLPS